MAELQPIAGQVVRVTTLRLGGGEPMHVPYIVAEPDPAEAEQLVLKAMTLNERATALYPLPANVTELPMVRKLGRPLCRGAARLAGPVRASYMFEKNLARMPSARMVLESAAAIAKHRATCR